MKKQILFLVLGIFLLSFVSADDIISVNAGGDLQLCIDSGAGLENCFSGDAFFCVPLTCSILGYECNNWSDNCGGTLDCGTCSSGYSCNSGICVSTAEEDEGDGGGTTSTSVSNLSVSPTAINLVMLNGTYREELISITNTGNSSQTISISKTDIDGIIRFETYSMTLAVGETKYLNVTILAPLEEGDYFATIKIGSKSVAVSVSSKSKLLLFDSNIVVLNTNYKVMQSDSLRTKVELTPMGDKERLDVTLNYVIGDATGKVYLTQSETVLVEEKTTIYRDFGTGMLPVGDYIIGLELIYPNGVAPSSARFKVVENIPVNYFFVIPIVLIIGIIFDILLILYFIIRMRKKKQVSAY